MKTIQTETPEIGENEIWESVLFCVLLKTDQDFLQGKINPTHFASTIWEKCITIMNMKRKGVPFAEQQKVMSDL